VVGRIPDGPYRLAEARAHLAREIAVHQAKLDRYAALVAGGNGVCVGGSSPRRLSPSAQ
jgi:hypothetical protein